MAREDTPVEAWVVACQMTASKREEGCGGDLILSIVPCCTALRRLSIVHLKQEVESESVQQLLFDPIGEEGDKKERFVDTHQR